MIPKTRFDRLAIVIAFVMILSDAGLGQPSLVQPAPGLVDVHESVDALERTWEGGGSRLAFVDDMEASTASRYAAMPGMPPDYYGGAIAEARGAADRWAQDPYRWGLHALQGDDAGWNIQDGHWRFGTDAGGIPVYPADEFAGGLAELVSPIIDLRHLHDATDGVQATVEGPDLSRAAGCDNPGSQLLQPLVAPCQTAEETVYQVVLPGNARNLTSPADAAAAALRIRHAYDFHLESGGGLSDGGRIEATAFDSATGSWGPWTQLQTVDKALRVGDEHMMARYSAAGVGPNDVEVDWTSSPPHAGTNVDDRVAFDSGDPTGSPLAAPSPRPHMYQGPITSSPGGWVGFGGTSGGWVESVFDLSAYAGDLVRLRLLASTHSEDGGVVEGHEGWIIDAVEVHSAGPDLIDILGLGTPGDGAVLQPGSRVEPYLVLHNPGRASVDVSVVTTLDGAVASNTVRLGVGPASRAFVATGHVINGISAGFHALDVQVSTHRQADLSPAQGGVSTPEPVTARFHFVAGDGGDWSPHDFEFLRVDEEGDDRLLLPYRQLSQGQQAVVRVTMENTGPAHQSVFLGNKKLGGDVRPALVDSSGKEYGQMRPLDSDGEPLDGLRTLVLPPHREVSGAHGVPGAHRVAAWEWSGTLDALALQLVLLRWDGVSWQTIMDGGLITVQSVVPPPLNVDFRNPWILDPEGFSPCQRLQDWAGRMGVIHCPSPPSKVISPAIRVLEIDLLRGNQTTSQTTHRGGSITVTLEAISLADPGTLPPVDGVWENLKQVTLPASTDWRTTTADLAQLPAGFSGFVRVVLNASQSFDLDHNGMGILVQSGQDAGTAPLHHETWDVTFAPGDNNVRAAAETGLIHFQAHHAAGVPDVLQDSWAVLPALDLTNAGRPELSFRHWYQLGRHETAVVEVATLAPVEWPTGAGSGLQHHVPSAAGTWEVVDVLRGSLSTQETREHTVSLSKFAGQQIHIRLRHHVEPTATTHTAASAAEGTHLLEELVPQVTAPPPAPGWLVEGVRVTGWTASGPSVVHEAGPGFGDYSLQGARWIGGTFMQDSKNCWVSTDGQWTIPYQSGANTGCITDHGVTTLVTGPMQLGAMRQPTLALVHSGEIVTCWWGYAVPFVDLEYQVLGSDGAWPAAWMRANPTGPASWDISRTSTMGWMPLEDHGLPDPDGGRVGRPFYQLHGDETGITSADCVLPPNIQTTMDYDETTHRFDLTKVKEQAPGAATARFRISTWSDRRSPDVDFPPFGGMQVHAIKVGDNRHFVDAGIAGVRSLTDSAAHLAEAAPEVLLRLVAPGELVVEPDQVTLAVNVSNEGAAALDVSVSLRGINVETGEPLSLRWIDVQDGRQIPKGTVGKVRLDERSSFEDSVSREVLFRVDMQRSPPGEYRLSARVDVENGVDTKPSNDLVDKTARLLPFRDIRLDPSRSSVDPFVSDAQATRTIQAHVTNFGNLREGRVEGQTAVEGIEVQAALVEMVGLTEFQAIPLAEGALPTQLVSLEKGGAGQQSVQWQLDSTDIPVGTLPEDLLQSGKKYAIKVTAVPTAGSITEWWGPGRGQQPLAEADDGSGLINITRMPTSDCQCLIIPFLVERVLWETGLTPATSRSILPEAYPVATIEDIEGGWATSTLLDGVPVTADERPDLPHWILQDASASSFEGTAIGKVWHLPAYEGKEEIQHMLVSPPMPGHVVADQSRAILAMRYASDLEDGQASLQVRQLVGDDWTAWAPVDTLRSHRFAIVLAPDFPDVIASGLSSIMGSYNMPSLRGNHPLPPFYDNPADLDYIDTDVDGAPTCHVTRDDGTNDLCMWSAPPDFDDVRNDVWVQALDHALRELATHPGVGAANVALFTTPNPELGIGVQGANGLSYTVHDSNDISHTFPIRTLDALGLNLDSYGTILLMGDSTKTFARDSSTLLRISHGGPGDWANRTVSPLAIQHHEELFTILRAAPQAGVKVLGTLGPAAAALTRSGAVGQPPMAVWQTDRFMPTGDFHNRLLAACTGVENQDETAYTVPPPSMQPIDFCTMTAGSSRVFDDRDPHNYYLLSPYDAQSLALREFVQTPSFVSSTGSGCMGPFRHPFMSQVNTCIVFPSHLQVGVGDVSIHSAGWPDDASIDEWIGGIFEELGQSDGALPAGSGAWQSLPPRLSFPVGGSYWRSADGMDHFDGSITQVRVVVESRGDLGGHGAMAIDRLGLLGTNRTVGLGVRFVTPLDMASYAPGYTFVPKVAVINRGVEATPPAEGSISFQQLDTGPCGPVPVIPDVPFTVDGMDPGQHVIVPINGFNGGVFPFDPECQVDLAEQRSILRFTARIDDFLDPDFADDDSLDDEHVVTAFGRHVVGGVLESVSVRPKQSVHGQAGPMGVVATVTSSSTQEQTFVVHAALDHARPLACWKTRINQFEVQEGDMFGCGPGDRVAHPIPLDAPTRNLLLDRDETGSTTIIIDPSKAELVPGVYRLTTRVFTTGVTGAQIPVGSDEQWVRLTADGDVQTARAALPPDGAFATDFTTLSHVMGLNAAQPGMVWDPSGLLASNPSTSHDGRFGPDPTTQDGGYDAQTGQPGGPPLDHGWRVASTCTNPCPGDVRENVVEWRRDPTPSYREGVDPASWTEPGNNGESPQDPPDNRGFGDFGPDHLVWLPHDPSDRTQDAAQRQPYLSMASFEDPRLTFLTRYAGTQNTGFVVQMQVPQRTFCTEQSPGGGRPPVTQCPGSGWNWDTAWHTLRPENEPVTAASISMSEFGFKSQECGPTGCTPAVTSRNAPSNSLAGLAGFWGAKSGVHPEDEGWVRLSYPLDIQDPAILSYCESVASPGGNQPGSTNDEARRSDRDPCRYAHASGNGGHDQNGPETYIARPVRFRFSAASYGGDAGTSFWQIADLAVSDHKLAFLGPSTVQFQMLDNDEVRIPVRIQNDGATPDDIRISMQHPPGRITLFGTRPGVEFSRTVGFGEAAEQVDLHLEPGERQTVWVRVQTGILDNTHPGTIKEIPFLVRAESLVDPTAKTHILMDGSFETRSWPDLEPTRLVLGDDDSNEFHQGSVGVPIQPTLLMRNAGQIPVGTDGPIRVDLVEREIDPSDDAVVPGSERIVQTKLVDQVIQPFREDPRDIPVHFDEEWIPPRVGLFELEAVVNPEGALEESSISNNHVNRFVSVGPVRFADMHLTDIWLVRFTPDGCADDPVERIVAGHAYCVSARVENRGRAAALEPRVSFGIGSGAPFSAGSPSLQEMFPGGVFPGASDGTVPSAVVKSSPRALGDRPDGVWSFYAEATSRSIFPNFDNKLLAMEVPVDRFGLKVLEAPETLQITPGGTSTLEFKVKNTGTAATWPTLVLSGGDGRLQAHPMLAPRLLPGAEADVVMQITAAPDLGAGPLPDAFASTLHDDKVREALGTRIEIVDVAPPRAILLNASGAPGPLNVTVALDAADQPARLLWSIDRVEGPLVLSSWSFSTPAYGRAVVDLPAEVEAHTRPGGHPIAIHFTASLADSSIVHQTAAEGTLNVPPAPSLNVTMQTTANVVRGVDARLPLRVENTGNVPLGLLVRHSIDQGTVTDADNLTLPPGHTLERTVIAATAAERALGRTSIEWVGGSKTGNESIEWSLRTTPTRIRILDSDLATVTLRAGSVHTVGVRLESEGIEPVAVEVLAVVDGVLHGRTTTTVLAGASQDVVVPLQVGPAGQAQHILILVRPLGSSLDADDGDLYVVGDAVAQTKVPRGPGRSLDIPVPGVLGASLLLVAAALWRRRT